MTEPVRPLEALKQAETHLTNLRLELNDWVPCSTQQQLTGWRDIQQRLINCAKVVGVLHAAAPPAPAAEPEARIGSKRCRDCGTPLIWLQSWQGWDCVACNRRELWQFIEQASDPAAPPAPTAEPSPPNEAQKRVHVLVAETRRCINDGEFAAALRKLDWIDRYTSAAPPERVSEGKE